MSRNANELTTWSEPVLLRRRAAAKTGRNYESQFEITGKDGPLNEGTTVTVDADENEDICQCRDFAKRNGSRKPKGTSAPLKRDVGKKVGAAADETEYLENFKRELEMKISKYQVEEAIASDSHNDLVLRYERLGHLLSALLQYVECVLLELKASYRLCQQLNGLVTNDNSLVITESLSQLVHKLSCDNKFDTQCEIQNNLLAALENSPNLSDLEEDYFKKRNDFDMAIANFKIILQSDCMNFVQLEKLAHQLDAILLTYQQSRELLDQELPDLISIRVNVLTNSLDKLSNDMHFVGTQNREIGALFKQLQISLGGCKDLVSTELPMDDFFVPKTDDMINFTQN